MRKTLSLLFLLIVLAAGCDTVGPDENSGSTSVVVANQGNFGDGNGSITYYDVDEGTARQDVVAGIGSIVQSAYLHDDRLYVVANTGGRIEVYTADGATQVGQIDGLVSPRYVAFDEGRAYVTNLYGSPDSFTGGSVSVVDLATNAVVDAITVGDNPEGLALAAGRLYVANHAFGSGRTVSVIDPAAGEVVETIDVDCDGPRTLVADEDDDVFVFCTGRTLYDENWNPVGATDGAVRVLDGATGEIVDRIEVDGRFLTEGPGQDAFLAPERDLIYAVLDAETILRLDTGDHAEAGRIGPLDGAPIGAVAYDAASDLLYVSHVPGFTTAGAVTIHEPDGTLVGSFTAGIAPTYITFRQN